MVSIKWKSFSYWLTWVISIWEMWISSLQKYMLLEIQWKLNWQNRYSLEVWMKLRKYSYPDLWQLLIVLWYLLATKADPLSFWLPGAWQMSASPCSYLGLVMIMIAERTWMLSLKPPWHPWHLSNSGIATTKRPPNLPTYPSLGVFLMFSYSDVKNNMIVLLKVFLLYGWLALTVRKTKFA